MHFCNKNPRSEYSIDNLTTEQRIKLDVSECERDLRVFVSSGLGYVANLALKTNKVLGMLVKNFAFRRDVDLWKHLHIKHVRPHLEFSSSVWNPNFQGT